MKKVVLLLFCSLSLSAFAQKGTSQFALFGGYEYFPEMWDGTGYDLGIEYKYYVHNRIFVLAGFHAGVNDGSKLDEYERDGISYSFNLMNSVRDYMIGLGLGGDVLHINRHKIYLQGTVGLGVSKESKDGITVAPISDFDVKKTMKEENTRFAISASAGYDYLILRWLAVGVNYTGWQIGYEYKNSVNAKLSFVF